MDRWVTASPAEVAWVAASAAGMYATLVILTRLAGLRSFSKLSSFDFAVTVSIGSVLASAILSANPPVVRAAAALASLYAIQIGVATARRRWSFVSRVVDNRPLLLMAGRHVIEDNLKIAKVTRDDLRAKLREANVLSLDEVRAVIMESTGDVSVLHGPVGGRDLDPEVLEGVRGAVALEDGRPPGP